MSERPFTALIVDFGGVLTKPLQDAMVLFAAELGTEVQALARAALGAYAGQGDDLVVGFETGAIPEEEFAAAFAERLSAYTATPVDPAGLIQRIFRVELEEDMLSAVATARAGGYRTALLSNSWGSGLYPRERLDPLFDVVVISGEVGLRKPDPAIFELVTRRLDSAPESCVFVDDHPGHLVEAARQGMSTVLHRSPRSSIEELESLLGLSLR